MPGISQRPKIEPDLPVEGAFPELVYRYDAGVHTVTCGCGDLVATTDPLIARRFSASHVGSHAALRIVTPTAIEAED